MLATHAFYPIVEAFLKTAGVALEMKNISVAARVLAHFPTYLKQPVPDELAELGALAQSGKAMIIKLPNISASVPQLKECIKELQSKGLMVPDYPDEAKTDDEKTIKATYAKVLGSAVNPVLREGNSDRRAAVPVKEFAAKFPHKMGDWTGSKTCIRSMTDGDFYAHEKSVVIVEGPDGKCDLRIEFVGEDGAVKVLKDKVALQPGEVVDGTFMNVDLLGKFYEDCIKEASEKDILFSLHLKATMMKVSDPVMFGHCVKVYFKDVFAKYKDLFEKLGVDANNGLGDVYKKIASQPEEEAVKADIMATYERNGKMAMVDGGRGITNLHVPSDVIIDNSIPTAMKAGGKMWNKFDKEEDFLGVVPDRGYGKVWAAAVADCVANGRFDPTKMGGCPNVGLMAQKAEEYGSHPTTFIAPKTGTIRLVVNGTNEILMGHALNGGDIYRACFTKDGPIKDWVKLAVTRCRDNNFPNAKEGCKAIFWLDEARPHDCNLINKVRKYLPLHDTKGLDIEIMSPVAAMKVTCERARKGLNTITVTGNVLRDYLTDLFPIMELGTSAKMLSIVPMLAGGGMYETGAGGSAPKHVQQFVKEGHLRWDSLGEYLALTCALEDVGKTNQDAKVLAGALSNAVTTFLLAGDKNPGRSNKEPDNRSAHFWVMYFWADELSKQNDHQKLKEKFGKVAKDLEAKKDEILKDLIDCQDKPQDLGGYYLVDKEKTDKAMNPSAILNQIIKSIA